MHVKLVDACRPQWVRRSDIGLHDLKYLRIGIVEHMVGVLGRYLDQGWFYSCLDAGVGWGGVKCC